MKCSKCNDEKVILVGDKLKKCNCVILQKLNEYFQGIYENVKCIPGMNTECVQLDKNILICGFPIDLVLIFCKSFLFNTSCLLTHKCITPQEVIDLWLDKNTDENISDIVSKDFVLFILDESPPSNKEYYNILHHIFEMRKAIGKISVVYIPTHFTRPKFKLNYDALGNYLELNFKDYSSKLKGLKNAVDSKKSNSK